MCKKKSFQFLGNSLVLITISVISFTGCSSQLTVHENVLSQDQIPVTQASLKDADMVPEYRLGFGDELEVKRSCDF